MATIIPSYGYSGSSYFFFFSSRRRHTRYWRDWSSDVCSSDLRRVRTNAAPRAGVWRQTLLRAALLVLGVTGVAAAAVPGSPVREWIVENVLPGSGERRGGEEGRIWGSPCYLKKKKHTTQEKHH